MITNYILVEFERPGNCFGAAFATQVGGQHFIAPRRFVGTFGLPVFDLGRCLFAAESVGYPREFLNGALEIPLCEIDFAHHESRPCTNLIAIILYYLAIIL